MAKRRPTITALLVARDEARNLPRCLAALGWADEVVVVVDAASRDETLAIARRRADRVLVRPFDDFASQRNAGLRAARGDWVLSIDADERVTPTLAAEIRSAVADAEPIVAGYRVPIVSTILGRPFRYSGTQGDRPVRLFRRSRGRWAGAVHETIELRGAVGDLSQPLRHRSLPTMEAFLRKLNRYTSLAAIEDARVGRPVPRGGLVARPLWTFFKLYILKQGFRDGPEGFLFCALSGVSVAARHRKHRELASGRLRVVDRPRSRPSGRAAA